MTMLPPDTTVEPPSTRADRFADEDMLAELERVLLSIGYRPTMREWPRHAMRFNRATYVLRPAFRVVEQGLGTARRGKVPVSRNKRGASAHHRRAREPPPAERELLAATDSRTIAGALLRPVKTICGQARERHADAACRSGRRLSGATRRQHREPTRPDRLAGRMIRLETNRSLIEVRQLPGRIAAR